MNGEVDERRLLEAAETFLEHDFDQCCSLLRHYDSQIFNLTKFSFVTYTGLLGIAIGFFEFSNKNEMDLRTPIIAALGAALMCGLFFLASVLRNRRYFVRVARYVNEHRNHFLAHHPHGFRNKSRMYADPNLPTYMNWSSSHLLFVYLISALNGTLLVAAVYVQTEGELSLWLLGVLLGAIAMQVVGAVKYLRTQSRRT